MPAEAAATEAPVLLGLRPGLVDGLLRAVARLSQLHERLLESAGSTTSSSTGRTTHGYIVRIQ